ncbi:hypothetical protein LCGC14_1713740 [marine sediment metagenome]|uniref:Uncharacterized protein n=1 Tax=marine sediment metagenome TaxID=412755 RepID=A0A0F9HE48_9ZZZZ
MMYKIDLEAIYLKMKELSKVFTQIFNEGKEEGYRDELI